MEEQSWNVQSVNLGGVRYPYSFGNECIDRIISEFGGLQADRFIVVTDDNVLALHGDRLLPGLGRHAPVDVLSLPAGDGMKAMPNLAAHLERVISNGASRRSVVVAFGGGVPGNLAGVVAALLFRGVRLVHVPTTTVAAMDSVISLKQTLNSSRGKNHIGTYHVPEAVYLDVSLLRTLPSKQLRSGLCEATKNCLAIRPQSIGELREYLAEGDLSSPDALVWLLRESLIAKCSVTAEDSREQRSGLILEYGHTVGHAVELSDQRLRGADGLSHGEAVMFGMLAAAHVSAELGGLDAASITLHEELAQALGAPLAVPRFMTVEQIMDVVRNDNKRGYLSVSSDMAAMVVLRELGAPFGPPELPLTRVPLDLVEAVITQLTAEPVAPPVTVPETPLWRTVGDDRAPRSADELETEMP